MYYSYVKILSHILFSCFLCEVTSPFPTESHAAWYLYDVTTTAPLQRVSKENHERNRGLLRLYFVTSPDDSPIASELI
jgi:hypothetical protein